MTGKLVDRLVAAGVFLYAFVVYALTMAETAPFWDSGEFISSVRWLEVMHPPGAPFYILLGRFFTFFAPIFGPLTDEPVAFAANLVSVAASAATVLLTYLTIVRLVRVWRGRPESWSPVDRIAAHAGGVVGALAFAFSDSFWFNAVEAEVYALSMLFTAAVVWLALVWREETLEEEADMRARGQHPFGLKADRYLLIIAYLFGLAIGVHLLNLLALFFVGLVVFFTKFDRDEWSGLERTLYIGLAGVVSSLVFFVIYPGIIQWLPSFARWSEMPTVVLVAVIAALAAAVWWTNKNRRPVANLFALAATLVVIGYSTYGVIFLRADADPPINLNDPNTAERFVSYLAREQYGQTPLMSGPNLGTDFQRDVAFPRRWSPEPSHVEVYRRYSSDLDFFFQYQVGYMYWRYFLWNFAGKAGDYEGSPWISGLLGSRETANVAYNSPSERESRNVYFGLPLLLGLVGMAFHFVRDWRRALAVLALFLITGMGIILYLNQTPLQPRERDYSYVASFFAFALWIGIGATGLVELVAEVFAERGKAAMQRTGGLVVAGVLFLAVPTLMLAQGYADHDRSGIRLPTDFASNMLESTAPNAILFTNGDNDTYPLWYAQEVLGIRRDVRVVNLSLLQTDWYIKQLKNTWSRDSAPLPMSFTDEEVDNLMPVEFTPRPYTLPTPGGGSITWQLEGQTYFGETRVLFTSDLAILDILTENARRGWERPIYFAATVARSSEMGLQPFFQNEGLARRVMPERTGSDDPDGRLMPDIVQERLSRFRYRGLTDPGVQYDENARGLADVYRRTLATVAMGLALNGQEAQARAVLASLEENVSAEVIPAGFGSLVVVAEAYDAAGDRAGMMRTLRPAEEMVVAEARNASRPNASPAAVERFQQYAQFLQGAYVRAEAYEELAAFMNRLSEATGVSGPPVTADQLREEVRQIQQETPQGGAPGPAREGAAPPDAAPDVAIDTNR